MLHRTRFCALAIAALLLATAARADDTQAGRAKAQLCTMCHGPTGISVTPDAPNLAGQPLIYLVAQLRAYRSGARKHEVMAVIAKTLTDDDISSISAWFSSIRVEATAPL